MFGFFKKKKTEVVTEAHGNVTVEQFVTLLFSDEKLMMPVYLEQIKQESDAGHLGIGPLVYIWNVNYAAGSYRLSVNGKCVGHLLGTFVSREDPALNAIRDEAMKIISEVSLKSVQSTIQQTGVMPDVLFALQSSGENA